MHVNTHTPSLLEHRHQEIKYPDSPESQIHFHKVHEPKFMLFNHRNSLPRLNLDMKVEDKTFLKNLINK
jgi:hypothetical protein